MATRRVRIGGSFAPPLTAEKLETYRVLAESAPGQIREEMLKLIHMMEVFRETPDSKRAGEPHPVGNGALIVPLEDQEVKRIWDHVPWGDEGEDHINECDMLGRLFDKLPAGASPLPDSSAAKGYKMTVGDEDAKALRDAAFHLLWFARELSQDREPMTSDKLPK